MISICHECKLERSLHNNYTVMGHISVCPTFVIYVEKNEIDVDETITTY